MTRREFVHSSAVVAGWAAMTPRVRAEAMAEKEEMAALEARVDQAVASCDNAGRWITPDRWKKGAPLEDFISTRIFIAQMNTLADYLARIDAGATREAAAR